MNGHEQYLDAQVMTASPDRLHLMVIDGALRSARQGEQALTAGDRETAHLALSQGRDFVSELISGLNPQQDPELVERMRALFLFVYRNLVRADLEQDPRLVAEAIRVLEIHRETWQAVTEQLRQTAVRSVPPDDYPESSGRSWTT